MTMLYPIQNSVRNKLDLSGIWDFKTDPDGAGESDGWANGLAESRPIAVPGSWNEQYEDLFGYLGLSWYLRRAYVPSSWQGQRVFIRVGSANYQGTVYVNGERVGSHEGGHLPFAFEITRLLRWDAENVIAISVENELKPARVPSGNLASSALSMFMSTPRTTFDFYPFAGLHRPVVLYTVPQTSIDDVTVVTDIDGADGTVQVTARLSEPVDGRGSLTLSGSAEPLRAELTFTDGVASAALRVPGARLWSDTDPYLYELTVQA
jgi:beta-glucuronidase